MYTLLRVSKCVIRRQYYIALRFNVYTVYMKEICFIIRCILCNIFVRLMENVAPASHKSATHIIICIEHTVRSSEWMCALQYYTIRKSANWELIEIWKIVKSESRKNDEETHSSAFVWNLSHIWMKFFEWIYLGECSIKRK